MDGNQDISKIIGIIMENPDIIEKIKALADENAAGKTTEASADTLPTVKEERGGEGEQRDTDSTYGKRNAKHRRRELLSALKPYVKSERAKAIDTMLSVIDVLDVMKVR